MQKENCEKCIKHEVNNTKEPLHTIIVMTPLDLIHIEVSIDDNLHSSAKVVNVLVIRDHFTQHSMAFVTKDQKSQHCHKNTV